MNKYTKKIDVPQYIPKMAEKYKGVSEIIDTTKCKQLIREINDSNISESEKEFLRFAAMRHIKFDYSAIAEYYCHASKEMQELMEKSALVIIDIDDAIANGYIRLSTRIREIIDTRSGENNEKWFLCIYFII